MIFRLAHAFSWELGGRLLLTAIGVVVSILLARMLSPEDFGEMAVVTVTIVLAKMLIDVGLGSALIQRRKLHPAYADSVFALNLFAGVVLALTVYFAAPAIAGFYEIPRLQALLRVVGGVFVLYAFAGVQMTLLRRDLRFDLLAKVSVTSALGSAVVAVSFALSGAGVWSLEAQAVAQAFFTAAGTWMVSRWRPAGLVSLKALRRLWAFGFRVFLTSVLENVFSRLDTLIIARLFPVATLGYYNRARNLDQLIIGYSSGALMSVLFPFFSRHQHSGERFVQMVRKGYAILLFAVFFLLGGFFVVAQEFVPALLGDQWIPAAQFFRILLLSSYAYPLSALLLNVLISRGRSRRLLRVELYRKGIFSVNLLFGFAGGVEGYLYGLAAVSFVNVSLAMRCAARELGIGFSAFFLPFVSQAVVTAVTVAATFIVVSYTGFEGVWETLLYKGILFAVLYLLIGYIADTAATHVTVSEMGRLIGRKKGKI